MAQDINVLILVHGITSDESPSQIKVEDENYKVIARSLNGRLLPYGLGFKEEHIIKVFWGFPHSTPRTAPSSVFNEEEVLSQAEVQALAMAPDERSWGDKLAAPVTSAIAYYVKKNVMRLGLADAVFYASAQGEFVVRWSVFSQIFDELFPILEKNPESHVRLHFVAHSLGVTVAHDLAYLLFHYKGQGLAGAGFFNPPPGVTLGKERLSQLNGYQQKLGEHGLFNRLLLGSFTGMEGQLALFVFRSTGSVLKLARQLEPLEAEKIGVDLKKNVEQLLFLYVPNDLLGFPAKALYRNHQDAAWIKEVDIHPIDREFLTGPFSFGNYHSRCWEDGSFHEPMAEMMKKNWN